MPKVRTHVLPGPVWRPPENARTGAATDVLLSQATATDAEIAQLVAEHGEPPTAAPDDRPGVSTTASAAAAPTVDSSDVGGDEPADLMDGLAVREPAVSVAGPASAFGFVDQPAEAAASADNVAPLLGSGPETTATDAAASTASAFDFVGGADSAFSFIPTGDGAVERVTTVPTDTAEPAPASNFDFL